MTHTYDPFRAPATTSQRDPDAEHDQAVRERFARELVLMLEAENHPKAAGLVKMARTDGLWP
ncbi:hypothetical protein ABZ234_03960 [Nocardiopsis sp. NPDC006198]|uniref:hypothetical protein n=1 Tax=Nocardiopsis sp. NPDC006198 TaxID=3154472 RepID=UPI0033ADED6A